MSNSSKNWQIFISIILMLIVVIDTYDGSNCVANVISSVGKWGVTNTESSKKGGQYKEN